MTTKILKNTSIDLSFPNVVHTLFLGDDKGRIGGGVWKVKGSDLRRSARSLLRELRLVFSSEHLNLTVWLLVGQSAWQQDTRITRYKRLWSGLNGYDPDRHCEASVFEFCLERPSAIRFYGMLKVDEFQSNYASEFLVGENCVYCVAIPDGVDLSALVANGWSGDLVSDRNFIKLLVGRGAVVVKFFGGFDDVDAGCIIFFNPGLVSMFE